MKLSKQDLWFLPLIGLTIILVIKPSSPEPSLPTFTKGEHLLVQDCYGWQEAEVYTVTDKTIFVKGYLTAGTCIGLPPRTDQIIEVRKGAPEVRKQ